MRLLMRDTFLGVSARPFYELVTASKAYRRGVPVAEPMGAMVQWVAPAVYRGFFLTRAIAGMTLWELRSPTVMRKGWLPMATTRGDRLFIGLLLAAYVNLAWVGLGERMAQWFSLEAEPSVWISLVLSMLVLAVVMRKG